MKIPRFTIYDNEAKSVLQLVKKLGDTTNVVIDDMETKTDLKGDHQGSWQGIKKPTMSEEGMRGTVEKINEEDLPRINSYISDNGITPRDFGAKFDGVTDDSQAIQNAINSLENGEVILSGNIGIGSTITLKSGVNLNCINANINVLKDVNVIEFNRNTKIKGNLSIDTSSIEYTSSVLHFDGSKRLSYRDIDIETIKIQGRNDIGGGNAIHMECKTDQSDITFVRFGKVSIRGFEKGLFFDAPNINATTNNYINANVFDELFISDCDYYIYMSGDHSGNGKNHIDGNGFVNVQLQYNDRAKEIIHIEGWNNYINGYIWDADLKDVVITNLTESTRNNSINLGGTWEKSQHLNNGFNNYINVLNDYYDVVPLKNVVSNTSKNQRRFEGEYEDILHKADKLHTLTVLDGTNERIVSGTVADLFQGHNSTGLQLNLLSEGIFKFELQFNGRKYLGNTTNHIPNIKNLGISFMDNRPPKKIIVDVYDTSGAFKTTEIDMTGRSKMQTISIPSNSINGFMSNISKIVFTFIGQENVDVRIGRIVASSFGIGGNRFISNGGGFFTGDVDMSDNYFLVGAKTTQPANDVGHYRKLVVITGASGVADKLMICLKDADGTYKWREI